MHIASYKRNPVVLLQTKTSWSMLKFCEDIETCSVGMERMNKVRFFNKDHTGPV